MTRDEVVALLGHVRYLDWEFIVSADGKYMQVMFDAPDLMTGEPSLQHGRKWILSEHMTRSEVVTTAFKAVITAVEHEARENFRYKRKMIFGPHFNVDTLADVANHVDVRPDLSTNVIT